MDCRMICPTFKQAMKKMTWQKVDVKKLADFYFDIRRHHIQLPAMLLMKKIPRSRIDSNYPNLKNTVENKQKAQKRN